MQHTTKSIFLPIDFIHRIKGSQSSQISFIEALKLHDKDLETIIILLPNE